MGATSAHFSDAELRCSGGVCNDCLAGQPPKNECQPALTDMLEQFRTQCAMYAGADVQIIVHSAYRCPEKNGATKNAAKNSVHQQGLAADVHVKVLGPAGVSLLSPYEMEQIAMRCSRVTGFGRDDHAKYVHLDARTTNTHADLAKWCYEPNGNSCTYYPPKEEA